MDMVVLDVNPHLNLIEDIFTRHIHIEEELLRFIPGLRFPVPKVPKYALGIFTNKPFYPWKSIDLFCRILKYEIYSNSEHYIDYLDNYALVNRKYYSSKCLFPDHDLDLTDIILDYIPNISIPDRDLILNTINDFINKNYRIISDLRDNLIDYDMEGEFLIIKNLGSIHSYRYKEAIDANRNMEEMRGDQQGNF